MEGQRALVLVRSSLVLNVTLTCFYNKSEFICLDLSLFFQKDSPPVWVDAL